MAKRAKPRSRLTAQGQISVPAPVREKFGLTAGSILEWDAQEDRIIVRRAGAHSSEDVHRAVFPDVPRRHDLGTLKEGIRRYVRRRAGD